MSNLSLFMLNSGYKLDMIAKVLSGNFSFRLDEYNQGYYKIPHDLGFTPLVSGFWGVNSSLTPAYAFGYEYRNPEDVSGVDTFGIWSVGADNTYIWFRPINQVATKTYHYKIYCLVPSNLDSQVPSPNLSGFNKLIFNSDMNYLKLFKDGEIEIPSAANQSAGNTITIAHNLGYLPFVRSWNCPQPGNVFWLNNARSFVKSSVDSQTVKFSNSGYAPAEKVIYRIYADEA